MILIYSICFVTTETLPKPDLRPQIRRKFIQKDHEGGSML